MYNKVVKTAAKRVTDLSVLPKHWVINSENKLARSFKLKNFEHTWGFLNQIAMRSHLMGHHPEIKTCYNKVEISLFTHDLNSVSDVDFVLAEKINSTFKIYSNDDNTNA